MLAGGGAPTDVVVVVVVPAIVDDEGAAAIDVTVDAGLLLFEPEVAVRAMETPTPPTNTATTVAAIVRDFLLMFWNRFILFSFEHLQPPPPEQELLQQNARRL